MTRKATDVVSTIGIYIGKNTFHLIGLEGRFGSWVCGNAPEFLLDQVCLGDSPFWRFFERNPGS